MWLSHSLQTEKLILPYPDSQVLEAAGPEIPCSMGFLWDSLTSPGSLDSLSRSTFDLLLSFSSPAFHGSRLLGPQHGCPQLPFPRLMSFARPTPSSVREASQTKSSTMASSDQEWTKAFGLRTTEILRRQTGLCGRKAWSFSFFFQP